MGTKITVENFDALFAVVTPGSTGLWLPREHGLSVYIDRASNTDKVDCVRLVRDDKACVLSRDGDRIKREYFLIKEGDQPLHDPKFEARTEADFALAMKMIREILAERAESRRRAAEEPIPESLLAIAPCLTDDKEKILAVGRQVQLCRVDRRAYLARYADRLAKRGIYELTTDLGWIAAIDALIEVGLVAEVTCPVEWLDIEEHIDRLVWQLRPDLAFEWPPELDDLPFHPAALPRAAEVLAAHGLILADLQIGPLELHDFVVVPKQRLRVLKRAARDVDRQVIDDLRWSDDD